MKFPAEKTALVVDDEHFITELICSSLEHEGFQCMSASNGAEALERLAEQETAFVLTDVRMPGMSGLDLLEQVRLHYPDAFVILLTGAADVPTVIRALRSGACDFLTKPFSLAELSERMTNALVKRCEMVSDRETQQYQERRMEHMALRYKDLAEGVLLALSSALGTKHPETQAHSERVALRSANLAESLQLPAEDVRAIYVAGLLHDVGKVAVDTSILDKPGRLDTQEFDQIRSHPVESARIVEPIALSPVTLQAIRHHHEQYDGSGYPDKLAGEEIPLAARILAVCDAFDAMTSDRAYQSALPCNEGFTRLQSGAGRQWDPAIVEVFCRLNQDPRDL